MNFEELTRKLKEKDHFSMIRWGDGELGWLFKDEMMVNLSIQRGDDIKENIYKVSDLLKKQLDRTREYENFYNAPQNMGVKMYKEQFDNEFKGIDVSANSMIIHGASIDGSLSELFDVLKNKDVIVIGRSYLKGLERFFSFKHIVTPERRVWSVRDDINNQVNELKTKDCVILYSCSAAANICIVDNHSEDFTQIDTGSVFDPYCGQLTRRYHKTEEFKQILKKYE